MNFGLRFKRIREDFQAMIAQKREKTHARATGQTVDLPISYRKLFQPYNVHINRNFPSKRVRDLTQHLLI